jgi:hypothetical protein
MSARESRDESRSALRTLHIFEADLPPRQTRALLDWCMARGADSFTVGVVGTTPDIDEFGRVLESRLAGFSIPASSVSSTPESNSGAHRPRPGQLWRLTPEPADLLWQALGGRLLGYSPAGAAWCEDPAFYRRAELMLAIVSHESEGVLRIRPEEQALLDAAGITYRLEGVWVGY